MHSAMHYSTAACNFITKRRFWMVHTAYTIIARIDYEMKKYFETMKK